MGESFSRSYRRQFWAPCYPEFSFGQHWMDFRAISLYWMTRVKSCSSTRLGGNSRNIMVFRQKQYQRARTSSMSAMKRREIGLRRPNRLPRAFRWFSSARKHSSPWSTRAMRPTRNGGLSEMAARRFRTTIRRVWWLPMRHHRAQEVGDIPDKIVDIFTKVNIIN